ncbi:gamma adaptin ear containing, arf binding protein [Phytophthora boehmeriae]|uniref:Gamma adaptin ear containing, arf binding protein n=1 Tax=Phytophthora boehmeriae TaxID=109152 RepID=A0A8T1WVV2_9STRA|nr:gamma adaptin ear containing, arf binding protein [Phytophthora boehmeriae]
MDAKMQAWRKRMPTKRQLTSTINQLVQQKSVAVLYTPTEQERIKQMTEMITQATSDYEADEDWDRILRVVDALSNVVNRSVLKESIRSLRLRLGDPSSRVVILALTLTEAIVKNCGDLVHQEIATEAFMGEMEELYRTHANKRGRESMEIASRVLDMVQAWGEAFLPFRHEFPLFVDTYHNMRKKGIKFPEQYDESKVPVLTPHPDGPLGDRSAAAGARSSNQTRSTRSIDTSSYSNTRSELGGLSTRDLCHVATNVAEMFEDMLFEAQKDASALDNHGVMDELAVEVREIVHRLEGAIPIAVAEGDENLEKYLSVNDELHAALGKYDALQSSNQTTEDASKIVKETNVSEDIDLVDPFGLKGDMLPDNQESNDDDPFADFVRSRTEPKKKSDNEKSILDVPQGDTKVSRTESPQQEYEEDDPFASFVQQRATKGLGNSGHNAQTETKPSASSPTNLIDLWDGETDAPTSTPVQPTSKSEFWLENDILSSSNQPVAFVPSTASTSPARDIWNGANTSTSITSNASLPDPLATTNKNVEARPSDPFDMLDFTSKASISSTAPANPFDPVQPAPQPQQPPQRASFNPFDF